MQYLRNLLSAIKHRVVLRTLSRINFLLKKDIVFYINDTLVRSPYNHMLSYHLNTLPFYSRNVSRLSIFLNKKIANFKVIDVGGNIGDTAALIRTVCDAPVICIEGDDYYYRYLQENTKKWKDVECYKTFLGNGKKDTAGLKLIKFEGTAFINAGHLDSERVDCSDINSENKFMTLDEVLDEVPAFANAQLLKIDTDGFEPLIVEGAKNYIAQQRPAIFLEYAPAYYQLHSQNIHSMFDMLLEHGYNLALIYENTGQYLFTISLTEKSLWTDLTDYLLGPGRIEYVDICFFHKEADALALDFSKEEKLYFGKYPKKLF